MSNISGFKIYYLLFGLTWYNKHLRGKKKYKEEGYGKRI